LKKVLVCLLVIMLVMAISMSVVFASDGTTAGPDWTQIIIVGIGLVFTGIITPLVKAAFTWLKSKTQNEAILTAITEAQSVADNVVASLQQNLVSGIKLKNKDGKLTGDDIKGITDTALNMFVSDISHGALSVIENNADDTTEYIKNLIEARLLKLKS